MKMYMLIYRSFQSSNSKLPLLGFHCDNYKFEKDLLIKKKTHYNKDFSKL